MIKSAKALRRALFLALLLPGSVLANEAKTARSLDESTLKLMAFDTNSESAELPSAYVGDKPGDVVRVKTSAFGGVPLMLHDGRLMLWSNVKTGETWIARAVFSKDDGVIWSEPTDLCSFPDRKAQWGGQSALVDDKGYLHFFGLEYYSFDFKDRPKSKSHLWHVRSRDGGKTWDEVQRVECGYSYVGCVAGPFQTKQGRLVAPISALSDRKIGVFVSLCPYSDDYGATWDMPASEIVTHTGSTDWYESGNAEPVGIQLKDGRSWIVTRSQDGVQWETFSEDNALTWSKPRPTRFVSNQSQMTSFRLKDGRLILAWNNCGAEALLPVKWQWAERTVIAVAISADEGKTWNGYREIARAVKPGVEMSNPHIVQTRNGRVMIYGADTFVSLDPDFLTRTDFSENFDRGLRRWSTLPSEGVSVVPDPDGGSSQVLKLIKPKTNTSAACLNFPFASKGAIAINLRIQPGFQGAHLTLSDHYDLPGLAREASFPVRINNKGRVELNGSGGAWLPTPGDLVAGKWHELKLTWNCVNHEALLELDGAEIGQLHQFVATDGVCYLRLRSIATDTDVAGMYIRSVKMNAHP